MIHESDYLGVTKTLIAIRQKNPELFITGEDPVFEDDLDAVLRHYNQVLDVSRDDLKALLAQT
jgi:hypothetical protein